MVSGIRKTPDEETHVYFIFDSLPEADVKFISERVNFDFEGVIAGFELDMAFRSMVKEYRVWKHKMFTRLEQEKKDGG